jgi:molybdopterin converting factor small subunit
MPTAVVEFFGVPRLRAGVPEVHVTAGTVGEALGAVAELFPALGPLFTADGQLSPHYLLSLDGVRFDVRLTDEMQEGARLLLLSADAGG